MTLRQKKIFSTLVYLLFLLLLNNQIFAQSFFPKEKTKSLKKTQAKTQSQSKPKSKKTTTAKPTKKKVTNKNPEVTKPRSLKSTKKKESKKTPIKSASQLKAPPKKEVKEVIEQPIKQPAVKIVYAQYDIKKLVGTWCARDRYAQKFTKAHLQCECPEKTIVERCDKEDQIELNLELTQNEPIEAQNGSLYESTHLVKGQLRSMNHDIPEETDVDVSAKAMFGDNVLPYFIMSFPLRFSIPESEQQRMDTIASFSGNWDGKDTIEGGFILHTPIETHRVSSVVSINEPHLYIAPIVLSISEEEAKQYFDVKKKQFTYAVCKNDGTLDNFFVAHEVPGGTQASWDLIVKAIQNINVYGNITCKPRSYIIFVELHVVKEDTQQPSPVIDTIFFHNGLEVLHNVVIDQLQGNEANLCSRETDENCPYYKTEKVMYTFSLYHLLHKYLQDLFAEKILDTIDFTSLTQTLDKELEEAYKQQLDIGIVNQKIFDSLTGKIQIHDDIEKFIKTTQDVIEGLKKLGYFDLAQRTLSLPVFNTLKEAYTEERAKENKAQLIRLIPESVITTLVSDFGLGAIFAEFADLRFIALLAGKTGGRMLTYATVDMGTVFLSEYLLARYQRKEFRIKDQGLSLLVIPALSLLTHGGLKVGIPKIREKIPALPK